LCERRNRQRVAIQIAVVGQHVVGSHRCVFDGGDRIFGRDRHIFNCVNCDCHDGCFAIAFAVIDSVTEGVGAAEVGVRRVAERAVVVVDDREAVLREAIAWCRDTDLFLAMGSSLVVQPAAGLPTLARESGARLVIINREPTPLDHTADIVIHAGIGETMEAIEKAMTTTETET
jgi:NAD-dependent SIR2 family protein deacetylase